MTWKAKERQLMRRVFFPFFSTRSARRVVAKTFDFFFVYITVPKGAQTRYLTLSTKQPT
jgi:hypothetical protein